MNRTSDVREDRHPADVPARLSMDMYRKIAGQWLTGVAIITAVDDHGRHHGLTMNAVTPLSLDPPQFLVSLDLKSVTLEVIRASRRFGINFLGASQQGLSGTFARKGGDKFATVSHHTGQTGVAILDNVIAHVECFAADFMSSGDHVLVVGDAICGNVHGGEPLVYHASSIRTLIPCS